MNLKQLTKKSKKANELLETASFDNPITKSKTLGPIHFGLAKLYEKKAIWNCLMIIILKQIILLQI